MQADQEEVPEAVPEAAPTPKEQLKLYHVRFRDGLQPKAASSKISNLVRGETVMVQTDHGPEPALVAGAGIELTPINLDKPLELLPILRRASTDELGKYQNLLQREEEARRYCQGRIQDFGLGMKLLQVERYFNGSKVIFYFSSETRVDFRDLVKALVQEFRTRVEMRQIGVRHETQMLGGIGCCGRELCCSLFMKDFVPVSIKMAKEQDLPLNPAKISGVCNRLLCCLTHEYETYKALKKGMPKVGRQISFEDRLYKVNSCKTLNGTVSVTAVDDARDTRTLSREEWEQGVSSVKGKELDERPPVSSRPVPVAAKPLAAPRPSTGRPQPGSKQLPASSRPPAPGRKPPTPLSQAPAVKPAPSRNQGGRPGSEPSEPGGKPLATKPSRSRRSKGRRKGKQP